MDVGHDGVETVVNLFGRPLEVFGVLRHFETGNGHTTCVDSLTGSVGNLSGEESVDSFGLATHVRYFGNHHNLVFDEFLGVFGPNFVLGGAGKSDVNFLFPGFAAGEEL